MSHTIKRVHKKYDVATIIFLIVLLLVLLSAIGQYGFLGPDEPRYARIAQEMMNRGDWVVPTLDGSAWLEKPPLLYWMMIISYKIFGVSEFSARLPSVFSALFCVFILWWFIRQYFGRRSAFFAALTLGTSIEFIAFAGAGVTDMPLCAAICTGSILLFKALVDKERSSTFYLCLGSFSLALGTLAKGPLAITIPTLTFLPFIVLNKVPLRRLCHIRTALAISIFILVAFPWYYLITIKEGFYFILIFFINHHIARFFTMIHHHTQGPLFYIPVLLLGIFPWTPFVIFTKGIKKTLKRSMDDKRPKVALFFLCWILFPLIFFSISRAKLPGYVLPLFPPIAAVTGIEIDNFLKDKKLHKYLSILIFTLYTLISLAAGLTLGIKYGAPLTGAVTTILIFSGPLFFIYFYGKRKKAFSIASFSLSILLPILLGGHLLFPILEPYHSHRKLCQEAMHWTGAQNPLVIYKNFHHTNDYYTNYTCTRNITSIEELENLLRKRVPPVYILTSLQGVRELKSLKSWKIETIDIAGRSTLLKFTERKGVTDR